MVADYIATVKRIKQRNLNDRLGELAHQSELSEKLNPFIESNEKFSAAITNELKQLKEGIEDLNKHLQGRTLLCEEKREKKEAKMMTPDTICISVYIEPIRDISSETKKSMLIKTKISLSKVNCIKAHLVYGD